MRSGVGVDPFGATHKRGVSSACPRMRKIYQAIYGNSELAGLVCGVGVDAYNERRDEFGQPYEELYYSRAVGGDVAARVNWSELNSVDFERIWTTNYANPAIEEQEAQDAFDQAVDCLVDEGIFDNWFCP